MVPRRSTVKEWGGSVREGGWLRPGRIAADPELEVVVIAELRIVGIPILATLRHEDSEED